MRKILLVLMLLTMSSTTVSAGVKAELAKKGATILANGAKKAYSSAKKGVKAVGEWLDEHPISTIVGSTVAPSVASAAKDKYDEIYGDDSSNSYDDSDEFFNDDLSNSHDNMHLKLVEEKDLGNDTTLRVYSIDK